MSAFVGSMSVYVGSVLGVVVPGSLTENSLTEDSGFPAGAIPFDFDGDGDADTSTWTPTGADWKVLDNQGNLTSESLGFAWSVIVPGDFDGDNITDKAVWTNGTWKINLTERL